VETTIKGERNDEPTIKAKEAAAPNSVIMELEVKNNANPKNFIVKLDKVILALIVISQKRDVLGSDQVLSIEIDKLIKPNKAAPVKDKSLQPHRHIYDVIKDSKLKL
jgi:hypothetical protein